MPPKSGPDAQVQSLLAAVRDGQPVPAELEAALAFLSGEGDIEALSTSAALAALDAAVILGRAGPVAASQGARDKVVRKAARAAAHKLRSAGLEVAEARTATVWSLGKELRELPAPMALLGLPEDDGYVPYLLASFGEEEACVSAGMAGPGQGFRDAEHGHPSRSQARRILEDAAHSHRMFALPFHEAIHLLERAFDAAGNRRPGGWAHLLSHVDASALQAARILDPLRALPTVLDEDALHRAEPLLDGRFACVIQGDVEVLSTHLARIMETLGSQLYPDPSARRAAIDAVIDEATDALLPEATRLTWAWSLDLVALAAARAGDTEASGTARATALALRGDRAGRDIPWAREWVNRQLSAVTDQVIRGRSEAPEPA